MTELQRVLAALDAGTATIKYGDAMADAARVIRELSAQLEAEEATNDRLRDEIAEAVGARERMAAEVERLRQEAEAREKANALDELEAWLTSETRYDRSVDVLGPHARATKREFDLTLYQGGHHGSTQDTAAESLAPTLAAAIRAALEKARGA